VGLGSIIAEIFVENQFLSLGGKLGTDTIYWKPLRYRFKFVSVPHFRTVNLLNDLPSGKEMVKIGQKMKRASNLPIANPS
jgi:hypothetical protein